MGIILVFLICHLPRNILNFHEITTIKNAMACAKIGKSAFPFWAVAISPIRQYYNKVLCIKFICINHLFFFFSSQLFLVFNSSANSIMYILINKPFRAHFVNLFSSCQNKPVSTYERCAMWKSEVLLSNSYVVNLMIFQLFLLQHTQKSIKLHNFWMIM